MFRMMPANEDGLLEKLRYSLSGSLEIRFGHPLFILRSIVSSPRLKDIFVREFPVQDLVPVGDTYLDKHTMLADENQRRMASAWPSGRLMKGQLRS